MHDWLADIPNWGVPSVPGVPPQKSAIPEGCSGVPEGVPRVPEHMPRTPGTPSGTLNTSGKSLKNIKEHREHVEHAENSKDTFDSWVLTVSGLDPREPQAGHDPKRWYNLLATSIWWLENFGRQAAVDGWQTHDVFGVIPGDPGAGGLIDRLGTSRSLVMEGRRSRWRAFGVPMKLNAGAYAHLPAFWEES